MGASWHPPAPGPPAHTPEPAGSALTPLFSMQLCSARTSLVPFHWGGAGHTASISVGTSAHIHCKSPWSHLHQPQLVPSGPAPGRAHGAPGSGHASPRSQSPQETSMLVAGWAAWERSPMRPCPHRPCSAVWLVTWGVQPREPQRHLRPQAWGQSWSHAWHHSLLRAQEARSTECCQCMILGLTFSQLLSRLVEGAQGRFAPA